MSLQSLTPVKSSSASHVFNVSLIYRFTDTLAVYLCGALAFYALNKSQVMPVEYEKALIIGVLATIAIFTNCGVYQSWRGRGVLQQFSYVFSAWILVCLSMLAISVILKVSTHYSRMWFFIWMTSSLFLIFLIRGVLMIIARELRSRGYNRKNIIIVGAGNLGRSVAHRLNNSPTVEFNILYFLDESPSLVGTQVLGTEVRSVEEMGRIVREEKVHEVWLALPLRAEKKMGEVIYALRNEAVSIRFIPNIFNFRLFLNHRISEVEGMPTIDLNSSPMEGINRLSKALEDRVLGTIFFCLSLPVMCVIAILIKLESKGPVLFKQKRHGWDGREINVYKFRTMYLYACSEDKVVQATKNDLRVTKVGYFLRRTSLDELPQLYNVLQGRMSLVGPRPHAVSHNEYYKDLIENYFQRHRVKPGITGWAQVNGWRGETETIEKMKKRIECDLYYIQNWSIGLDLKILALTIVKGFISRRAY